MANDNLDSMFDESMRVEETAVMETEYVDSGMSYRPVIQSSRKQNE